MDALPDAESRGDSASRHVSMPLRVAAAWSWRGLVVLAAACALLWLITRVNGIAIPILLAVLVAALLEPMVVFFNQRCHLPKTLAAALGLVVFIVTLVAAVVLLATLLVDQVPSLIDKTVGGFNQALAWLNEGPLGLPTDVINSYLDELETELTNLVKNNSQSLASGAISITSSLGSFLTGMVLMFFCLFFFLKDGRRIWIWVVRLLPAAAREPVHESAIRGWVTLSAYVRTQIKVAAIDAVGIGLAAVFLGLPMALPIAVVVFFGSFIPIVGALISGAVAVLVALVDQGFTSALIMLIVILLVQQIEGNLLQPWLMSSAVSLHPVAVLLAVSAGAMVAGLLGALFAVPAVAFVNATFLFLYGYDTLPHLATDEKRSGGPPGALPSLIKQSYANVHVMRPKEWQQADDEGAEVTTGETAVGDAVSTDGSR